MINSNTNDASPETVEDRELEDLLAGAFDAPPMPRSLLKRLDKGIEQEWGVSPRLADSQAAKLQRAVIRSSRWLRGLPIAAAVVLVLVGIAIFSNASTAYAWSTMLDALSKHGIVQFEQGGVTHWMSLSEGLAGESTSDASVLLNVKQNVLLRRKHDDSVIERESLSINPAQSRDSLAIAFLLGQSGSDVSSNFYETAHVVDQSWKRITIDGEERIQLNVRCENTNSDSANLQLLVDPKTHLPVACNLDATGIHAGATTSESALSYAAFSYSSDAATQRVARVFPDDMPIVDVNSEGTTKTALNDTTISQDDVVAVATDLPKPTFDLSHDTSHQSPLFGAASKWGPVEIRPSATGDRVRDLDLLLAALWEQNGVKPVEAASNEELLRRVYLDLAGRTPSVTEVRDYLKDTSPDRYEVLVNRLLNSPDHASHLAARFRSFLIPEGVDLANFGGVEAFEKWLSGRFASNEPYDKTVQGLLLAEGRLVQSGPLLFYSATKLEADQLAGRTARVFLGMRLECAQCHDHPFEPWSQEDFWGFAAFFARISRPRGKLENVSTVMQVRDVDRGEVMMPESTAAVPPKFLNASDEILLGKATERRQQLTDWLTSRDNPYFPRATANRVWSMLFGKGIVNPVDDFGVGNPPLSPELLDLLAGEFIQSNFNLKELFRVVALSKAYRLSSGAGEVDEARQEWFAQMNVKMLTAEQVYDCITVATMPSGVQSNEMMGLVNRFGNTSRDAFLRDFRTSSGRSTEYQGGIPQALTLMNGGLIDTATGLASSGLLKSLDAPFFSNDQRIDILYFATLSRMPKPAEKELLDQYITKDMSGAELREALSDVLWALLNSAEFTMNH